MNFRKGKVDVTVRSGGSVNGDEVGDIEPVFGGDSGLRRRLKADIRGGLGLPFTGVTVDCYRFHDKGQT